MTRDARCADSAASSVFARSGMTAAVMANRASITRRTKVRHPNDLSVRLRFRASLQTLFARARVPTYLARALGLDELLDALMRDT